MIGLSKMKERLHNMNPRMLLLDVSAVSASVVEWLECLPQVQIMAPFNSRWDQTKKNKGNAKCDISPCLQF